MASATFCFTFHAAHRILGCGDSRERYLHGHSFQARITIDASEPTGVGFAVNPSAAETLIGGWIGHNWDHTSILGGEDPLVLLLISKEPASWGEAIFAGRKPYIMANPTPENMAAELFRVAAERVAAYDRKLRVTRVTIRETPERSATCETLTGPGTVVLAGAATEEFFRTAKAGDECLTSLPPKALKEAARRVRLGDRGLAYVGADDPLTGKIKVTLFDPTNTPQQESPFGAVSPKSVEEFMKRRQDPMTDQEQIAHGIHPSQQDDDEEDLPSEWDRYTVASPIRDRETLIRFLTEAETNRVCPTNFSPAQVEEYLNQLRERFGIDVDLEIRPRGGPNRCWVIIKSRKADGDSFPVIPSDAEDERQEEEDTDTKDEESLDRLFVSLAANYDLHATRTDYGKDIAPPLFHFRYKKNGTECLEGNLKKSPDGWRLMNPRAKKNRQGSAAMVANRLVQAGLLESSSLPHPNG